MNSIKIPTSFWRGSFVFIELFSLSPSSLHHRSCCAYSRAGDGRVRDCPSPTDLIAAEACVVTTPPAAPPSQPPTLLSLRQPEPQQEKPAPPPEPRRTTTIYSRRLPVSASAPAEVPTASPTSATAAASGPAATAG